MVRRRRRRRRDSQNTAKILIVAAAVGLAVYVVTATALGSFISEKLIAPVLSRLTDEQEQPVELVPAEPQVTPQITGAGGEIRSESRVIFALQSGAFSSRDNAQKEAENLRARGGAGYIRQDTLFRVFVAVFKTEAEAKVVKAQLQEQSSLETSIYKITVPNVALRVIASEQQTAALTKTISNFGDTVDAMLDMSIQLDKNQIDQAQAKQSLKALSDALGEPVQMLASGGTIGTDINSYIAGVQEQIAQLTADNEIIGVDFSSKLKYNNIGLIYTYIDMLQKITSGL